MTARRAVACRLSEEHVAALERVRVEQSLPLLSDAVRPGGSRRHLGALHGEGLAFKGHVRAPARAFARAGLQSPDAERPGGKLGLARESLRPFGYDGRGRDDVD